MAILVYANKMDLPGAMNLKEIVGGLKLNKERRRQWFVQPSIAKMGDGLYEGLDWMATALKNRKKETA